MDPFLWIQAAAAAAVVGLVFLLFKAGEDERRLVRKKGAAAAAVVVLFGLGAYVGANPSDQKVVDRYHNLFYHKEDTWYQARWCGVTTWQNPNDVWIHQEIITELKPDYIVEAGTAYGGSAILWAMILQQVNPQGRIITIDIKEDLKEARQVPIFREKVDFLLGSSTDPKIVAEVKKRVAGKKVLVILDSLHTKDHVLDELRAYAPLVPVGSYLIAQDTNINGHPVYKDFGLGPWEAVDAFLQENDQFVPDRNRERFLFTMHPRGYLKRVK